MSLAILGIGTSVPPASITQAEATQVARFVCCRTKEQETWLPLLYDHTGIRSRHLLFDQQVIDDMMHGTSISQSVFLPTGRDDDRGPTTGQRLRQYAANAGLLALCAARRALHESGLAADAITHLVTVSCTGFHAPGVDYELIQGLKLAPTVQRTNVGFMGCHGALNGLRVARAFADAEPDARILVCAVELCGLHYHYGWDPQKMVANALFADGAAAVVGGADTLAMGGTWRVSATGSSLLPDSRLAMSWTIGDHGFEMSLSKRVPGLIREHLRPWLESWLAGRGLRVRDRRLMGHPSRRPAHPRCDRRIPRTRRGQARLRPRSLRRPTATCRRRRCCSSSSICAAGVRRCRASRSASVPASSPRPYCSSNSSRRLRLRAALGKASGRSVALHQGEMSVKSPQLYRQGNRQRGEDGVHDLDGYALARKRPRLRPTVSQSGSGIATRWKTASAARQRTSSAGLRCRPASPPP